jgi:hypothetical protein
MFVLAIGAAFVGFRDLLPGVLTLLMKALFVLFTIIMLVCLNIRVLRGKGGQSDPAPSKLD